MELGPSRSGNQSATVTTAEPEKQTLNQNAPERKTYVSVAANSRFAHLFALCALAVSQPILGRLGGNSPYLKLENINGSTLWLMLVVMLIGLPGMMFAIGQATVAVSPVAGRKVHSAFVFVLTTLLIQLFMDWISDVFQLKTAGVPEAGLLCVSAVLGWLFLSLYWRRAAVSQSLTIAALCSLTVPMSFIAAPQMKAFLFPQPLPVQAQTAHCENPVPVIMIVFDGLNGMALLNEQHELDAIRYPGFARLARFSTWYRNATTVHYRTDNAVPAILTGRFPPGDLMPVEQSYPDNLFRQIYDSGQYEMTVFEPFTRLCPHEIAPTVEVTGLLGQMGSLLKILSCVYIDTICPDEFSGEDSIIPLPWFGLRDTPLFDESAASGLANYSWDSQRKEQLDHFRSCLLHSDKPTFRFLHVVVPHYPWCYLPSGKVYADPRATNIPVGAHGSLAEDWGPDQLACDQAWQRYLLQLGFIDHSLNQILDQLQSQDMFDKSLVVVVADHGVAFKANTARRVPTDTTLEDLMPIPLFIKLPGQQTGSVSDRNVETIDVLPTIADVLKLSSDLDVDGDSLLNDKRPDRLKKVLVGTDGPIVMEPDFPRKFNYVKQMHKRFGEGDWKNVTAALNTRQNLIGRNLSEFKVVAEPGVKIQLYTGKAGLAEASDKLVPCLLEGTVQGIADTLPVNLVIVVNGEVLATTLTFTDPEVDRNWAAMLPEDIFGAEGINISIYELTTVGTSEVLRLCPVRMN